ncbi:MAG: hypothetical protein IKB72_01420 [Ruminococcus sp.]|nr:hypothetical protein [Ruminococcus sp.]
MAQKRLNEEFLEGIYEVYSTLMTNQIFLKLLDEDSTDTNVYEETTQKKYLDPIQLVGKFALSMEQGEQVVEGIQDYVTATIPTKSLLDKNVDITPENYETLKKGAISYKGVDYNIVQVRPIVNIDDVFQFYVFYCEKPKVRR